MKNITMALLIAGTAAVLSSGAFAQRNATPGVDQRQANQEKRIEQGVASGELTRRETRRLNRQQARVATAEAEAKADGTVTRAERRQLAHMQNHGSRAIARQKHDAQQRPAGTN